MTRASNPDLGPPPIPRVAYAPYRRGPSPRVRRRWAKGGRIGVAALSVAAHAGLLAMLSLQAVPPKSDEPPAVAVEMVQGFNLAEAAPSPEPAPPTPAPPAPAPPPPPTPVTVRAVARPVPARPEVETIAAAAQASDFVGVELSAGQLAGASTAGSGSPGRACDMVAWLQNQLRKSARVQAAVARAHLDATPAARRGMMIWDGDWVRSPGQDGHGLAGLREAIMMEVAFAPAACRADPVSGLVLMSLGDGPGSPRIVIGTGRWQWADLLTPRRGAPRASLASR
jgi:hypothetical protein